MARSETETFLINVTGIEYYFYIGKLPGWNSKDFMDFLRKNIDSSFIINEVQGTDSESFVFDSKWTFYKIYGSYKQIKDMFDSRLHKKRIDKKTIEITQNNYLLQNFTGDCLK